MPKQGISLGPLAASLLYMILTVSVAWLLGGMAYAQAAQNNQAAEAAKQPDFAHTPSLNPELSKVQAGSDLSAPPAKPLWNELTLDQQRSLSPLISEWDKLDATQKKKWLVISKKYSTLSPDQQSRLHERMHDWIKLTPEQRRAARENYSKAKNLDPSRKSAEWEHYQQLPEEQKRKLAEAAAKNRVANLPPASENRNQSVPVKNKFRQDKSQQPGSALPQAGSSVNDAPTGQPSTR